MPIPSRLHTQVKVLLPKEELHGQEGKEPGG